MADVFIALTRPENVDENWPPKIDAPIRNDAKEQASFGRTKSSITNSPAGILPPWTEKPPEESITNVEAKIRATGGEPVANSENFIGRSTRGGLQEYEPRDLPVGTPVKESDTQILKTVGATLATDAHHATIYEGPGPQRPTKLNHVERQFGAAISNEQNVTFSSTPTPRKIANAEDTDLNPSHTPIENNDISFSRSEGIVSNETGTILPNVGKAINPVMDTFVGGGGSQTKEVRDDEIGFGSAGKTLNT